MDLNGIELWTFEKLLDVVKSLPAKNPEFDKNLGEEISNFLTSSADQFNETTHDKTSKAWLSWCSQQKSRVKVSDFDIPTGILGSKVNGSLYDIKVQTKGPDDAAYNKYPDLREKVARGNSVLFLHDLESNSASHDGVIFALKKFTGGMGDEDETQPDDNFVWMKYFLKPLASARKVVCTRKANGEAAHLSVRYLPRTGFVLCVGSKNVHMIVRSFSDIGKYRDSRFQVARTVAEAVLGLVLSRQIEGGLEPDNLTILLNFLHHSKLTAVFEILQPHYQHVEDLSYLGNTCELNLITFTSPYSEIKTTESLCAISPDVALEFAYSLGLKTVKYDVIEASQAENRMEKVRKDYGYEGEVFYFLDSRDNVIGLLKKKTAWYVVARALREKAAAASNEFKKGSSGKFNPKSWETRLNQIQHWLGFSDTFKTAWLALGNGFIAWLMAELRKSGRSESLQVRGKFPIVWKTYLAEKGLKDNIQWS